MISEDIRKFLMKWAPQTFHKTIEFAQDLTELLLAATKHEREICAEQVQRGVFKG